MSLEEISNFLNNSKSVEVKMENGKMIVTEYKGITKTDIKDIKSLIRGKKAKLDSKRKQFLINLAKVLLEKKIPFKIILERDPLLKFDMDRYFVITEKEIKIFGFNKKDDPPLVHLWDHLKDRECIFYKPVK